MIAKSRAIIGGFFPRIYSHELDPLVSLIWEYPGPQYGPQNSGALIMGTPLKRSPNLQTQPYSPSVDSRLLNCPPQAALHRGHLELPTHHDA